MLQTVIETASYLADAARAGLSEAERIAIVDAVKSNPQGGDLIVGAGGARKIRFAGRGKGKSGGYRVITFYAADDVPVFLLALVSKGERADISQAERNALRVELAALADDYRAGMREATKRVRRPE